MYIKLRLQSASSRGYSSTKAAAEDLSLSGGSGWLNPKVKLVMERGLAAVLGGWSFSWEKHSRTLQ